MPQGKSTNRKGTAMPTKQELEAENATLRARLDNSTPAVVADGDVNTLDEGQYTDTADRDGSFTDARGVTHTYNEGDTLVYNADDSNARVISAEDANASDEDGADEPA